MSGQPTLPRVLVTRPQPQADAWVARLRGLGVPAAALPLIDIGPPADPAPVQQAWQRLHGQTLVVFVSPNAVGRFFAVRPAGALWPAGVWAGATGPGTSAALREAGVAPAQIIEPAADAPQFDTEALWARLAPQRDWAGAQVLVVRGEGGRDWLAQTLRQHGARVGFVTAYRRSAPHLDGAAQAALQQALAEPAHHAWLFSSSEAIQHLLALAPGARWEAALALASHPRIAARAETAGFGRVLPVAPRVEAVQQVLQQASIQSPAP